MNRFIIRNASRVPGVAIGAVVLLLCVDLVLVHAFGMPALLSMEPLGTLALSILLASCVVPVLRWLVTRDKNIRYRLGGALLLLVAFSVLHPSQHSGAGTDAGAPEPAAGDFSGVVVEEQNPNSRAG
jgi:hypothetical protein